MLGSETFRKASRLIMENARPLEKVIYGHHFSNGSGVGIVRELEKFRNEDGGFGNGLESDFRLPMSSPMATSIGVRILSGIDDIKESQEMIRSAVGYLESTFNNDRKGWFSVPEAVNRYPHAPWWHCDEESGLNAVDQSWGNPTAEIAGYMYRYSRYVEKLYVETLVETVMSYVQNKSDFRSEHEVYCLLQFYRNIPENFQDRLAPIIEKAVSRLVDYDENNWNRYVPKPLDFVKSPDGPKFGIPESKIESNLDYLVSRLELQGQIDPPWDVSVYGEDLRHAIGEWTGILSLEALITLDNFSRIKSR